MGRRLPIDRHPHLERGLSREAMITQRGEQAHHAFRGRRRHQGQAVVLSDRRMGEPVLAPGHGLKRALPDQPGEYLAVDPVTGGLAAGERPPLRGERQRAGLLSVLAHVA